MKENLSFSKKTILGFQHTLAMFGGTILIPLLIGFDPAVALLTAGLGTLLFHFITKGVVPVFLGSSIAYVPAIQYVSEQYGKEYALGGLIAAGLLYVLFSLLTYWIGPDKIVKIFPPVIIGPVIMLIGLGLAPLAISMAKENWLIASIVILAVMFTTLFAKGFLKVIPILVGIAAGYIASILLGVVDFTPIQEATLIRKPEFLFPKFSFEAIIAIAPIAFVSVLEHFADVNANGAVIGRNLVKEPGLHRTLLGDGLATLLAGFMGGPANTTYAENTGVLATTKVYEPSILRIAAVFAIGLSFIGFFNAFISTLPTAVLGGMSFVLFGLITIIGIRTMSEGKVDFHDNKNIYIASAIFMCGIGGIEVHIGNVTFSPLSVASFVGIILYIVLNLMEKKFKTEEKIE